MTIRTSRSRRPHLVGALVVAALATGCDLPQSDGGEIVVTTDDRIEEVRAARAALAEPVPDVVGGAEQLVEALERVWTEEATSSERAALAEALRVEPFDEALGTLAAVDLDGTGPDVAAAEALVDDLVDTGRTLLTEVEDELASVTALPAFDQQLEELLAGWDARGSYSQQLAAFEQLAADAEALAASADERMATPSCVGVWERRNEAASVVAARTLELRDLIRDRRGQEFDDLRDTFRQDPYGLGALLGVLDARAAADCWADASAAPSGVAELQAHVEDLAAALDPPDLQG